MGTSRCFVAQRVRGWPALSLIIVNYRICMYMYVYVCICMYMYVFVHICYLYTYILIYIYICDICMYM